MPPVDARGTRTPTSNRELIEPIAHVECRRGSELIASG